MNNYFRKKGEHEVDLCIPPPSPVSRLSAQRSSNMRRSRWTAREINMAWVGRCQKRRNQDV